MRWEHFHRIALALRAVAHRAAPVVGSAARSGGSGAALLQLHHRENPRHLVPVHVEEPGALVERRSAPLATAVEAGKDDRALRARRHELAVRAHLAELREYRRLRGRGDRRQVGFREPLAGEWRRREGQRLRRPRGFTLQIRRRNRALLDRKQRRALLAVEEEDVTGLGDLRHRVHAAAVALHGHQHGGGRRIAIPQIVVHQLVVPHALARVRLQREHRVGEQVCAVAITAPEIEGGRSDRQEHEAARGIHANPAPRVGTAHAGPGVLGPGIVAELAR